MFHNVCPSIFRIWPICFMQVKSYFKRFFGLWRSLHLVSYHVMIEQCIRWVFQRIMSSPTVRILRNVTKPEFETLRKSKLKGKGVRAPFMVKTFHTTRIIRIHDETRHVHKINVSKRRRLVGRRLWEIVICTKRAEILENGNC